MVQLSSCDVFANTRDATPLPGLTIKFRNKIPVQVQGGGAPQYGVQFNLLSKGVWVQFVFMVTGPTDEPASALAYGVDVMPVAIAYDGAAYVVAQTLQYGGVFPNTGVSPAKFNSGECYAVLGLSGTGVHVELRDSATDAVIWSTGPQNAAFPDFTYDPAQLPYICTVEAGGKYSGEKVVFTAFDAELDVMATAEIQGTVAPGVVDWGTYNDGTNGDAPLLWANETGEYGNLWTNIAGQQPQSLALELSLTKGNQVLDNPPLPAPVSPCSFPVTLASPPGCIYEAFDKSGYLGVLQQEVQEGYLPQGRLDSMKADPVSWLRGHPYLYGVFPAWFKAEP